MTQYSFLDDYSEGCHPAILSALAQTNLEQHAAYGHDDYSIAAKALIQEHLKSETSSIFFVAGGTLANLIVIASLLRPHEAVIAPYSGHIVQRETGAIEATGHKIISVTTDDGKLTPDHIVQAIAENAHAPHMVKPRLVYISNATETGRVYSRSELKALYTTCREYSLFLMLDGARLSAALSAKNQDVTLQDLCVLTDVFWLGGTKSGALIGEAIIINRPDLARDFEFHIKQRGALLAKGRLLGLQFKTLFETGLYFTSGQYANDLAQKISQAVTESGYSLLNVTETNQVFPVLPNALIEKLQNDFKFYVWEKAEHNHSALRLVTSWATDPKQVEAFIKAL